MIPQPPNPPDETWEQTLGRELKKLPDRPAPPTLIPRVLAAVQARARLPWWRRTWWTWPPTAQILSLVLVSMALGLVTYGGLQVGESQWLSRAQAGLASLLSPLAPLWACLGALLEALVLVFRRGGNLVLLLGGVFCVGMYLSCVGLGTIFYRVAVRK
jgi:predicted anti-sigma-YlaC factor YlaD